MSAPRTDARQHSTGLPATATMWRSLDEWAETDEFRTWLHREFPDRADEWAAGRTSRREFLRLMAASLALAGFSGCVNSTEEEIQPPVRVPKYAPDVKPLQFATTMPNTSGAMGLVVDSRDGRPIKIEGNALHPASLGATDTFAQAAVLELYDPDRSKVVQQHGNISSWNQFVADFQPILDSHRQRSGRGLSVLSPPLNSPTLQRQRQQFLDAMPEARWHTFEPVHQDHVLRGAVLAFGEELRPRYDVEAADVVLCVDDDLVGFGPGKLFYARQFAGRRAAGGGHRESKPVSMNRVYVVESTPTLTGASSDHCWSLTPKEIERFVLILGQRLGLPVENPAMGDNLALGPVTKSELDAMVSDLTDDSRRRLVTCGAWQPPEVHALVYAINERLGAIGTTVFYEPPIATTQVDEDASLAALTEAMSAGEVETLLIVRSNPVFSAPADLDFAEALDNVPLTVHYDQSFNETAALCDWHLPASHFLESWGDATAFDGTASLIQPLIDPLYDTESAVEFFNMLLGDFESSAMFTVQETWRIAIEPPDAGDDFDFEALWVNALHDGVIPGIDPPQPNEQPSTRPQEIDEAANSLRRSAAQPENDALTAVFRPHPTLWDGEFANNGWLQELPQPFTHLTWGNAALIARPTAQEYQLKDGDVIDVVAGERSIRIPVIVTPGQPRGVVTLPFGAGRTVCGRVGDGVGTNVYALRTSDAPWIANDISISPTGERQILATTQHHFLMESRHLVRSGTSHVLDEHPDDPPFMHTDHGETHHGSLYDHMKEGERELLEETDSGREPNGSVHDEMLTAEAQWGMAIDLTACIGCQACVIACQAENNIPVVGPEEVKIGREMHWIRVDTYYSGEPEQPQTFHQPVPCMHCEHAPCEPVCPVAATTHSREGLNEMTYNRCIGTRYCSINCPYKVRRFNFFDYSDETRTLPVLQLLQNPEVTIRSRGVMEKCTYCVQRISRARIDSEMEGRPILDGEVVTACQAVCPTQAIVFGDISDRSSRVSKLKASPLNYELLGELNTRPRTTYLAEIRNPHPELSSGTEFPRPPSGEEVHHDT